jgi:hypothetical protein
MPFCLYICDDIATYGTSKKYTPFIPHMRDEGYMWDEMYMWDERCVLFGCAIGALFSQIYKQNASNNFTKIIQEGDQENVKG